MIIRNSGLKDRNCWYQITRWFYQSKATPTVWDSRQTNTYVHSYVAFPCLDRVRSNLQPKWFEQKATALISHNYKNRSNCPIEVDCAGFYAANTSSLANFKSKITRSRRYIKPNNNRTSQRRWKWTDSHLTRDMVNLEWE